MRRINQEKLGELVSQVEALLNSAVQVDRLELKEFLQALQHADGANSPLYDLLCSAAHNSAIDYRTFITEKNSLLESLVTQARANLAAYQVLISMLMLLPYQVECPIRQVVPDGEGKLIILDFLEDGLHAYCFDKQALQKWFETKNDYHNPVTRSSFSFDSVMRKYLDVIFEINFRAQAPLLRSPGLLFRISSGSDLTALYEALEIYSSRQAAYNPTLHFDYKNSVRDSVRTSLLLGMCVAIVSSAPLPVVLGLASVCFLVSFGFVVHRLLQLSIRVNNLIQLFPNTTVFASRQLTADFVNEVQFEIDFLEQMTCEQIESTYAEIENSYQMGCLGMGQSTSSRRFYKNIVTERGTMSEGQLKNYLYKYLVSQKHSEIESKQFNTGNSNDGKRLWCIAIQAIRRVREAENNFSSAIGSSFYCAT